MDVRRIQITGGSSFMITLPKEWAESVGLKKNDPVGLQAQPDGSMIIYPAGSDSSDKVSTKVIEIGYDYNLDFLYRQLVGAYIAGHDVIEVVSDCDISSTIAGRISSFVRTAIGLEIMDKVPTRFHCDCSKQRVEKAIAETGFSGIFTGGLTGPAAGITVVMISAVVGALIFSCLLGRK